MPVTIIKTLVKISLGWIYLQWSDLALWYCKCYSTTWKNSWFDSGRPLLGLVAPSYGTGGPGYWDRAGNQGLVKLVVLKWCHGEKW